MIVALLVSRKEKFLSEIKNTFEANNIETLQAYSGKEALSILSDKRLNVNVFDVVVADEELGDMSGLTFIKKVVGKNPMINSALVSSLSQKDYHDESEGLGILMQLPTPPSKESSVKLLDHLKSILKLLKGNL